jgi:hypothetical protein
MCMYYTQQASSHLRGLLLMYVAPASQSRRQPAAHRRVSSYACILACASSHQRGPFCIHLP